ncbi:MAG TPA: glycosyltransferase family 9 protein [Caldilineae bacterium]|nr:glycosyltransferase family 9 protein [Caldilineae bacterium]
MSLERIIPPEEKERLARQHLAARASRPERTTKERVRLRVLRILGAILSLRPRSPSLHAECRILVIRPDHIGDVLFITPALARLRERYPSAHITAMVGPWARPILAFNPDIDALWTCPFPGFTRQSKKSPWQPYCLLRRYAALLRASNFDAAIILRDDHWWGALLAAWASIPFRIGYDVPEVRPFLTKIRAESSQAHEVVRNLHLIDPDLHPITPDTWPLRFTPTATDSIWADDLLRSIDATSSPLVVIHPGSGAPVKAWRVSAWARVADALIDRHQVRILITGGKHEQDLAQAVADAMKGPSVVLAGQTTLGQLAALMGRCALALGPDSGPLHLAVAMGTPTVHLFGPADPRRFGPWGDPQCHRVITSDWACAPCGRLDHSEDELPLHGCVRDIPEEAVLETASELLAS